MKKYYAVEFWAARNTTTGRPNAKTGRMNTACDIEVFGSSSARDEWVKNGKSTSAMRGNCRQSVTRAELRGLKLGWSISEFNQFIAHVY